MVFVSIDIYGWIVALRRGLKLLCSYFYIEGSSAVSDEPLAFLVARPLSVSLVEI